ncbi:2-oxoglutarate-dependent dioxygenase 33-like isoform X2 [Miscanthus floridulus]|uniref:2-oxoglutarate-dependent dioxygenase 33-like isoform X2 n=1 Tax=Miscanthus floridulus TaxID=154761 RepID=UPI003458E887
MDSDAIPLIDIVALVERIDDPNMANDKDLLQVVQMLDGACKNVGFFYVKGHGICDLLMREVRDVAKQIFQLPYDEKMKIKMTPDSGYRGYQRLGQHITSGKRDMHEAINYLAPVIPGKYGDLGKVLEGSNVWPEYLSNSKLILENYSSLLKDLSRKIMRGIALALGGPVDAFEGIVSLFTCWFQPELISQLTVFSSHNKPAPAGLISPETNQQTGRVAGEPYCPMGLISYPVSTDVPEEKRTETGMGAHTDYDNRASGTS